MMMKHLFTLMVASMLMAPTTVIATTNLSPAELVEARKMNFKQSGSAMRQMRGQLQNDDMQAIASAGEAIAAWAEKMPSYFPEGTGPDTQRTNAKASIWQEFDKFTALAQDNQRAALALVAAAKSGEASDVMAQMQALGKTCGACHSNFKN